MESKKVSGSKRNSIRSSLPFSTGPPRLRGIRVAYRKAILDNYCDTMLCGHRAEYRVYSSNNELIGEHCYKHAVQVTNYQSERERHAKTVVKAGYPNSKETK